MPTYVWLDKENGNFFYVTIMRSEIVAFAEKWMDPEISMVREICQTEKEDVFSFLQNLDFSFWYTSGCACVCVCACI